MVVGDAQAMSLMAVLAGLDNPEGFWHFMRLGLPYYRQCLTEERLSQALFAACILDLYLYCNSVNAVSKMLD